MKTETRSFRQIAAIMPYCAAVIRPLSRQASKCERMLIGRLYTIHGEHCPRRPRRSCVILTHISMSSSTYPPLRHFALVRMTHWLTAAGFISLLVSGIAILLAHPRLYWGETGA